MLQMMKRDYLINKIYFLMIFLAIPFLYTLDLSLLFMYLTIIVGAIFTVFYYDDYNHVYRALISMPIKRSQIVFARYLFLFTTTIIFLLYIWLIDMFVHNPFSILKSIVPTVSYQPISAITILLTFLFISIVVAISTPIFYYFQSFMKSLIAHGVLLVIGVMTITIFGKYLDLIPKPYVRLALYIIAYQPLLFVIGFSIICLYISYLLSTFIFSKRDVL